MRARVRNFIDGGICFLLAAVYLALIGNWQSHVGVRLFSPDADTLAFSLLLIATPLALFLCVSRLQVPLPPVVRHLCILLLMCGFAFGITVLWWNSGAIGSIMRGRGDVRLIATVPFRDGRIDAYQIKTSYFGPHASLRLQSAILPGVLLSKEFAVINRPIDRLSVLSPNQLCVTFTSPWSDLNPQRTSLVSIGPFASQDIAEVGFKDGALPPDCSSVDHAHN
jgi:hypothetical protein